MGGFGSDGYLYDFQKRKGKISKIFFLIIIEESFFDRMKIYVKYLPQREI